jgi:DNA-binding NarL/FixJ family response regulator
VTFPGLTKRQSQVAVLIHRGWTDKQIADALGVSVLTAKTHAQTLFDKLAIREPNPRVQLAVRVERWLTDSVLRERGNPDDCINTRAMLISA